MTALELSSPVAVVGAGTMGQGIAQVALVAGHPVRLYDAVPGLAKTAAAAITARLDRLVEKGRLDADARAAAARRLQVAESLAELAGCGLVIEAVIEQLDVKQQLFQDLEEVVAEDCLLATNTSSLSVTAVAGALTRPGRLVGLHFFNPAPLLPLVEVVSGFATDAAAATRAYDTAEAWGKTPVRSADTPGFIVNRIARPFYAEALRVYEEGVADPATIDAVLRECGGFRMGPFELTDLIGQDVNEAVTRSVWESFFQDPKFAPSLAQRRLVESRRLGRKTGHGWYAYGDGAPKAEPHTAEPADAPDAVTVSGDLVHTRVLVDLIEEAGIRVERGDDPSAPLTGWIRLPSGALLALADGQAPDLAAAEPLIQFDLALDYRTATRIALAPSSRASERQLTEAVGLFQALGKKVSVIGQTPGMIVARTVFMLVDFALDAVARGVASADDIDTAMRLGVNYPRGPLAWGRDLTAHWVACALDDMNGEYGTGRYAPSLALRRAAAREEHA
ncbi:3-hydroxyacyl-CoA dehydrogenase [Streptomyces sp. NPDC059063]|uniref:3-hydroxyacyl-CoA dehydrogenase n=1 Tax=unclassified Streptomyces TaxID=2593676 RepID=UPI0036C557DA